MAKKPKKPSELVRIAGADVPLADVSHITPSLRALAEPIDSLKPDPRNARLHGDTNRAAIRASLAKFGQQETISADADGVILAGNGRWTEAKALGWKYVAVARTHLTGAAARAWALSANRTGELAEWDAAELQASLDELKAAEFDLEGLAMDAEVLAALNKGDFETAHGFAPKKPKPDPDSGPSEYAAVTKIIINCPNERFQADLIDAIEKNNAGDPTKLGKLMKNIEYTAPNVA